jgi:DNA-binding NarL/FixJ family response regulator
MELRVLVVADDPLARAGLAALLAEQPECVVVGQMAGGEELPREVDVYRPDVVLWDLGWDPPPISEISWPSQSPMPIVALLPDETYTSEAWRTGVRGLLLRDIAPGPLLAAMQTVVQGLVALDPALTSSVLPSREQATGAPAEELTSRELEVLQLLAEGLPNKTIAHRLEISEHTVKFHVNAILGKLDAQSRTEAVVRATRLGLILL